jgi:hypothetical protein
MMPDNAKQCRLAILLILNWPVLAARLYGGRPLRGAPG